MLSIATLPLNLPPSRTHTMTRTSIAILARIDELILDLVRQLAAQATSLHSCPADERSDQEENRQTKRPKKTQLRLCTFAAPTRIDTKTEYPSQAENQAVYDDRGQSNISFPTKGVVGMRRFGEPDSIPDLWLGAQQLISLL